LARAARLCLGRPLAVVLLLAGLAVSQPCRADDPVRGEATFTSGGGFARLVLKLAEDVESEVSTAGSIIIIHFKRPVDIPVDKLSDAGSRLCRLGAARSRRYGDPAVAVAAGNRQHHDGGGADLRRLPAR
jgi:hypothetical protein